MKKYINFRNFGIVCFAFIIISLLCSFVGKYPSGSFTYKVETVRVDGANYVVAVSDRGGISICPSK